jgi:4-hydroxy-tetrahydrodipicolinate synthase
MIERDLTMFTMSVTPFHPDGSVDEEALRIHLLRLVDGRNGIYVLSGGTGEGHVLTPRDARQICEIAVEVAKGKVPVYANPRESRSARDVLEYAREAVAAGIDVVQIYQLDGGHGMKPTLPEQEAYWRAVLDAIDHPVAISIHPGAGFLAPPSLLASLCEQYPRLQVINVVGLPLSYVTEVREAVPQHIKLYGHISNIAQVLALGCAGALQAEGNIIPKTCRGILDAYLDGDMDKLAEHAQFVQKFANIVNQWAPSTARWLKMAMKVLGMGNGVLRPPYLMPDEAEQRRMATAFQKLRLREVEGIEPAMAGSLA